MSKFLNLAVSGVQSLSPYIPGKPIEELEREYHINNAVKLASNENPYGPSPNVIQKLTQFLSDPTELSRYPDGSGYRLKNKLSKFLSINTDRSNDISRDTSSDMGLNSSSLYMLGVISC